MILHMLVFVIVGGALGTLIVWLVARRAGSRNPLVVYGLSLGVAAGGLLGSTVGGVNRATGQSPGAAASPGGSAPVALLTTEQFDRTLEQARTPVLVDFYADWCGPCHMLAPTVEQLAREWSGRAAFYKVNVDQSPELANQMRIESIPMLIIFANGQEIRRLPGLRPKADLTRALEEVVARYPPTAPAVTAPPAEEPSAGATPDCCRSEETANSDQGMSK